MKNEIGSQWESEKKMFFDGLENGTAFAENDFIGVTYLGTADTNDPRWIYYKSGETRLTDDHFCRQHSDFLSVGELRKIKWYAESIGVNIEIPDYMYDEESGYPDPFYDNL